MLNFIDAFLNRITMYRLVLYVLTIFVVVAGGLALVGLLPFSPLSLLVSTIIATAVCWALNTLLGWAFKTPTNVESVYITAFILVLIIPPANISLLVWASVLAMASKFIIAIGKKHIFNPAAIAVVITSFALGQSASWWVATVSMLPVVLMGGLLIVKKIGRFSLVLSFILSACVMMGVSGLVRGVTLPSLAVRTFTDTTILFFAFIMLTEPLTTPPTRSLQVIYGGLVGVLWAPFLHIGSFHSTPELALVMGNIFSYLVSPKVRRILTLKEKIQLTPDIYDFVFQSEKPMAFRPGQYMEWTLGQEKADSRGNRRYFTLASSPTESNIRIGLKFYDASSSFKRTMHALEPGDTLVTAQLAGDFVLPRDPQTKLIFIAGGIGITPFRSMIQYLIDRRESRSIVLLYSNKIASDVVYRDVFDRAQVELGLKTVYVATDTEGYLTAERIMAEVPDWRERMFYLSGPHAMVTAFEHTLSELGVPRSHIRTDFFPGFV